MADAPCGRGDCPVAAPVPALLRRIRTTTWPAGKLLYRGLQGRRRPDALVPGRGDTRFAPLAGTQHVYLSSTKTAALLESALHHLSGPEPTIYLAELSGWSLAPVRLTTTIRLADLRDEQLGRLELARSSLVDTDPLHYACTRRWGGALQHRRVGGYDIGGVLWHSRQADLHARAAAGGLFADLLSHRATEVAVLWHPRGPRQPLARAGTPAPLLNEGRPTRLIVELSALLGAPIE